MSISHIYLPKNRSKMDDLLRSQIHQNCKLALPEGLKDLMSDISREVLRDQPKNLYQFIANYLGALLEARETLTIACQVCSDICKCTCEPIEPELYHELRKIGLDEEDLETTIEIIEKHLKGNEPSKLKEQTLLSKLLRKTSMNETQLPAIQQAIQKAFKRHWLGQGDGMDFRHESNNETSDAVHHTLKHKQNKAKVQIKTEEILVAHVYKPCITTVSSSSLAGSFVPLPKFRPYNAHDNENSSDLSEKEQSIDDTKDETTKIKQKKIEIRKKTTVKENNEKYQASAHFEDNFYDNEAYHEKSISVDDYDEATTSTGLKPNKVKISDEIAIEEIDEPDRHSVSSLDNDSDKIKLDGYSNDEVQELIENDESEIESSVSSVAESIQNDIGD